MNKNQSAHYKEDLYSYIAKVERRNERLLNALVLVSTISLSVILILGWWANTSLVTQ